MPCNNSDMLLTKLNPRTLVTRTVTYYVIRNFTRQKRNVPRNFLTNWVCNYSPYQRDVCV